MAKLRTPAFAVTGALEFGRPSRLPCIHGPAGQLSPTVFRCTGCALPVCRIHQQMHAETCRDLILPASSTAGKAVED